jgi:hypothetical protein
MTTKNCLLIGCGSKFGLRVLEYLMALGYNINSISGSELKYPNVNHLQVDWKTLNVTQIEKFLKELPEIDLIFLNQNSSALNTDDFLKNKNTLELWKLEKDWSQSYFISCILPFHIIHTVKSAHKIVWMLSPLIYKHDEKQIGFADYVGNKYQNYLIIKNFSKQIQSICIGLNPDKLLSTKDDVSIKDMIKFVESADKETSGRVFFLDGTEDTNFNKFNND